MDAGPCIYATSEENMASPCDQRRSSPANMLKDPYSTPRDKTWLELYPFTTAEFFPLFGSRFLFNIKFPNC